MNTLRLCLTISITAATVVAAASAEARQADNDKPFTRAEILAYLRSIPKSAVPDPGIKAAHQKLTALIKQRGVDFVQPAGKFDKEFYDAGITAQTSAAIWQNYRAPGSASPNAGAADPAYFTGRWAMGISGTSTRFDRQGSSVVRKDQLVGATGGYLDVAANGTYVWRYSSSSPEMRGQWRAATEGELGTEAGKGIVLLRGYDDGNWLVTRRPSEAPGEHITVRHVSERYRDFIGGRPAGAGAAANPSRPAAVAAQPRSPDAQVEQILRDASLSFEKSGQARIVVVKGTHLQTVPVALTVVGDNLLARSTYRPTVSVSSRQLADLFELVQQRESVSMAFLKGEVVAYATQPIASLDVDRLKQLISEVALAVDVSAVGLAPDSEAEPKTSPPPARTPEKPAPPGEPDAGPRLGRYQILSYGNPANPIRLGHIELGAGGMYRYYSADGRLLGSGNYGFDAAKGTVIWKDGLLHEQKWTGTFTVERQGKTHKIRLKGATIAVNSID